MAYRQFAGVLGILEPIGMGASAFCGAHILFSGQAQAGPKPAVLAAYDLLVALIGLCALVYTQILRYRIGRDPALAEIYFKPLPEGEVASESTTRKSPSSQARWEWTPMAKLMVGLAVIAALAAAFVFASHRRHVTSAATTTGDAASGNRAFFDQKVDELNKLAPFRVNGAVDFVEARVTGMGIFLRMNLVGVNKTQITRSGGIPDLAKYSRSFICKTAPSRAVLDKGFWITSEYYDADGLAIAMFNTKASDCVW